MSILELFCRVRGRHVRVMAADERSRVCKICGDKQELSPAMLQIIKDYEFVKGPQWTLPQIEQIRKRQQEAAVCKRK